MNEQASLAAFRSDSQFIIETPTPAPRERRRHRRIIDPFFMTLIPSRGLFGAKPVRGTVRDYDEEGAAVALDRALPKGMKLRVRLHLRNALSHFYRGLPCEFSAEVRESRSVKGGHEVILKWERPLPVMVEETISSYKRKIGGVLVLLLAFVVWFKWNTMGFFWYAPFFYIYSCTLLAYLVSRFYLSWRYKAPELKENFTPTVSVVISVRNEENCIGRTVESVFGSDYPPDKLEVVVVDDGSTDGTPRVLKQMRELFPRLRVQTIKPSGKRHGMAEGVLKSHGEIIVFVDSDTFLWPNALRHLVSGFEDPTLGASAGYTEVENADKNMLTGLQEVRYFVSFQLLKSSESLFSCVTCCPGCLSAYRRTCVMKVLQPWLHQRFLGAPATFGDDRSLTNFILRTHRVIYNENAVCATIVPETWKKYMTQQVRWKKSWLRETMIAGRFMFKKDPVAALSFYSAAIFSLLSPAMVARVVYIEATRHDTVFLFYLMGLILVALLQSLFFLYKRPSPHWLLGMAWMASSLILTGPQTYYAMLTMRKNHWGTR